MSTSRIVPAAAYHERDGGDCCQSKHDLTGDVNFWTTTFDHATPHPPARRISGRVDTARQQNANPDGTATFQKSRNRKDGENGQKSGLGRAGDGVGQVGRGTSPC